jgi:hypothetical protein
LPSSSFDMFFACTVLVAAALIGTAFLSQTMQARIESTQDINKVSYLKAIADHLITNPGSPVDWGKSSGVPEDFGLATTESMLPFDLDIDKITRLSSFCNNSLSTFDLATSAKLNNIALGISVSQIMTLTIEQTSNYTSGSEIYVTFTVSTIIDSKPASSSLHCYVIGNGIVGILNGSSSNSGVGFITVQASLGSADSALLLVFARSSFDDRVTSYGVYNFSDSMQVTASTQSLPSPKGFTLNFSRNSSVEFQNGYVFSYVDEQTLVYTKGANHSQVPSLVGNSPLVIVMCGLENGLPIEVWTAYPQVPLKAAANFAGQEQNVFSYIVTVNGVLYRLNLSLGDLPS